MDAEAYHADYSRISRSMIEDFLKSSKVYNEVYVAKTKEREQPSREMLLGSALHLYILQPEEYTKRVLPKLDGRTQAGKEQKKAAPPGTILLKDLDMELVEQMAKAIKGHEDAWRLLDCPGTVEKPLFWQCEETGLSLKCMPDKYNGSGTVLDIKTTSEIRPSEWAKSALNFGYHRQAAHYFEGLFENRMVTESFLWVVVSTETCEVAVYRATEEQFELGRKQNRELRKALARCYASGDWRSPWSIGIKTLEYPAWAWHNDGRLLA